MVSFEHKQLLERLTALSKPESQVDTDSWLTGSSHLDLLRQDVKEDELIIAALSTGLVCLNAYVVPASRIAKERQILTLRGWSPNPYHVDVAPYSWSSDTDGVSAVKRGDDAFWGLPRDVSPLVMYRRFEEANRVSREILQDFVHAARIYWAPERNAYSVIDHKGDWLDILSQSIKKGPAEIDLFSLRREYLDLHLSALDAVLVRTFEFDLRNPFVSHSFDYSDHGEYELTDDPDLQTYAIVDAGKFHRIQGVQIVRPQLSSLQVEQSESEPVEFIVYDYRNEQIATVSTDPSATTNHFEDVQNQLPYEDSPAFFRSEVLSKYKADREKYTVTEHNITCRAVWTLGNYSVNEAGQVAAYICYLREIPHEERLHWKAYNERPKTGLSKRAIQNDFLGQWADESTPLEELALILDRWEKKGSDWWSAGSEYSHADLAVPYGDNRDEWARAILALSNSVVEGFKIKALRTRLRAQGVAFDKQSRSTALLERLMQASGSLGSGDKLEYLREVSRLRSQAGGTHNTGAKAAEVAHEVLAEHDSYGSHFEHLCRGLTSELELIEEILGGVQITPPTQSA